MSITNNATRYLNADKDTGVVTMSSSSFTAGKIPLYKLTTSGGYITNYEDFRPNPLKVIDVKNIEIKEDGTSLTTQAFSIDFIGRVTAINTGHDIEVDIDEATPPENLDALTDVITTSPTNLQVLKYQTSSSVWENKEIGTDANIEAQDEGSMLNNNVRDFNFVGGRVSATTVGDDVQIEIKANADALNNITDVTIITPANAQQLTYNSTTSEWENKNPTTGSDWTYVVLGANYTNSTTTYSDITGLSFSEISGEVYAVEANLVFATAATTTGIGLSSSFPAGEHVNKSIVSLTATTKTVMYWNTSSATNASSTGIMSGDNIGEIMAICKPSADGTYQLRARSEIAGSLLTIKAGSYLRWRKIA
jgi:hypothetical protein